MNSRGWSLRRRLGTALALAGAALLVVVVSALLLIGQVRDTQELVVADYSTANRISSDLFTGLVDSETSVRGYALTGDENFLELYERHQGAEDSRSFDRLLAALAGAPQARKRLDVVVSSARVWSREWAEPTVEVVRRDGPGALRQADLRRGQALFERVRRDYVTYRQALDDARAEALADLRRRMRQLLGVVVGAAVGALVAGCGLWLALRAWVTRPIADLGAEVRTVAAGRLDHPVDVTGPPEVTALARDVESMRRRLNDQLAGLLAAKAEADLAREALEAQAVELARSNQELEQFAYVASHDLQEPLRKVASFCQMLERRYKGQLDERADQYIAFAVDGAKRMQQLINDLLGFSRVGRITTDWTDVPLVDALAAALRNLEAAREDAGAEISWGELPVVRGEAGLLTQLFQNLVGNAIKFRGDAVPRVHIGARRCGEQWELSCADNGIGIEPRYADRIFVIFQRLHPRDEYDGTGIGLALCKKIVEYHGGRIWLDPAAGPGTTFRWTLPVAPREVETPPADDVPVAVPATAGGPTDV